MFWFVFYGSHKRYLIGLVKEFSLVVHSDDRWQAQTNRWSVPLRNSVNQRQRPNLGLERLKTLK